MAESMQVYGYKRKKKGLMPTERDFVNLAEASIDCTLEELDRIIQFLVRAREQHKSAIGLTDYCHSHYRDWDSTWTEDSSDIIVITTFEGES